MPTIEYQVVIAPDPATQSVGFRTRHFTYPKASYEKAVKAVMDFLEQRESGRFEKAWTQHALVYIEEREVSKWQRIEMPGAVESAMRRSTTSRPGS